MQITISPSVLNLPFLLGQDLAGSKTWLELIQKFFSPMKLQGDITV